MSRDHRAVPAGERLLDALAEDLLAAGDAEVLATHAGAEARVAADALRQALRRSAAASPAAEGDVPRRLLRSLALRAQGEGKP